MDSEERPTKIRKRSHDYDLSDAEFASAVDASMTNFASSTDQHDDTDPTISSSVKQNDCSTGFTGFHSIEPSDLSERSQTTATDTGAKKEKKSPGHASSSGENGHDGSTGDPNYLAVLKDAPSAGDQDQEVDTNRVSAANDSKAGAENLSPSQEPSEPKISKNQLKKQRRKEQWEAGREDRKVKRREKIKAKKERQREAIRENPDAGIPKSRIRSGRKMPQPGTQVPVTVILDCAFEDLMFESEQSSLGLQITRCYSDNRQAKYRTHLTISSFGGKLKERFDGILAKQYTSWTGVRFFSEDFVDVSEKAKEWMEEDGNTIAGALENGTSSDGEIIYLTSESDVTLDRLSPNSTYIIGGIVDKNRHKGLCHKRALGRGLKTARLPIGEYLRMNSRQVLTTNHVLEIMLKWLECGDWGKAFMEVIPKRKGGALKEVDNEENEGGQEESLDGLEAETPNDEVQAGS
ncbi:guanine-1-methyltransferase-domain-containing protein [Clohesyomyces aquaticus]|uniref:tRNA (guanine(9)-N1)-methyltransferase n=1 Tax=Clohesyomyces aquaticus TaxID=1231657 RepID=A0A1Y1ZR58_9PLEO|nr:guanine-1-methyltransferase-domain-containing protein [Clohesyomyces aquaticus]